TPNTAVATIDSASGVLVGVAAGGPLTARASFASCSATADTTVSVAQVSSISLVPPPALVSDSLIVGNTQPFTVLAEFND
ncbi:hypothetical protein NQU49_27850, partial [Escherichia coli]|uniref:hypothetical protein n=1 Tax=Escherichia coli TaxID=562 RepID=UPI0021178E76